LLNPNLVVRLSYRDIFDDKEDLFKLLELVPKNYALELLSIVNHYENKIHESETSELNFIFNEWLTESTKHFKEKIAIAYAKNLDISNYKGKLDFSKINIINRLTTHRVMELFLAKKETDDLKLDDNSKSENLFKIYLLASKEIADRQDNLNDFFDQSGNNKTDDIRLYLFFGFSHVSYTLSNGHLESKLISENLKLIYFDKWIKSTVHKFLLKEYLDSINILDLKQYLQQMIFICKSSINYCKVNFEKSQSVFSLLEYISKNDCNNYEWDEMLLLRDAPIYNLKDKEYIILDMNFLIEKFFSGVYHDLVKLEKEKVNSISFHEDYSKLFIEETLLVDHVERIIPKSYIKFSENQIKEKITSRRNNIGIPDYYVRNGSKVLMFECKNSFISNLNKIKLNFQDIEEEIKSKFYKNKKRGKAVVQLKKNIENLLNNEYDCFDFIKNKRRLRFYPILMVTDNTMCSLAVNRLLNEYFDIEKEKLCSNISNRIKPLTIVSIDDIVYFGIHLAKLSNLIDKYHKYIKKAKLMKSMYSFSTYLHRIEFKNTQIDFKSQLKKLLEDSILPYK